MAITRDTNIIEAVQKYPQDALIADLNDCISEG